jgi:hypothetical protein
MSACSSQVERVASSKRVTSFILTSKCFEGPDHRSLSGSGSTITKGSVRWLEDEKTSRRTGGNEARAELALRAVWTGNAPEIIGSDETSLEVIELR